MQVIKDGDLYKIARITGPTHNLLALRFGAPTGPTPRVEALDSRSGARLDRDAVRGEVEKGVADANQRLGTSYRVDLIQFVPDDTPPETAYRGLAERITEAMHRDLSDGGVDADPT